MSKSIHTIAQKVAKRLEGTCDFVSGILEVIDADPGLEDNTEFCKELDRLVFCCTGCDWWHNQYENTNRDGSNWLCRECFDALVGDEDALAVEEQTKDD